MVFAALVAVAFVLRIFYSGHLYEDDGLWFAAGEELLRGKALYREIYFDKPPLLPLLYALLFKLFGVHILTIRVFTILYSVAVAFLLYRFGARLYDPRKGLLAAAMFVVFSTTYTTGHFQGLNTDFLMTLPYTLGAYWFVRASLERGATRAPRRWFALGAGVAIGVAFQTNPKALFSLLFCTLCILFLARREASGVGKERAPLGGVETDHTTRACRLPRRATLALTLVGFLLGAAPFLAYVAATGSLADYWASVWVWGAKYASYYSLPASMTAALRQSLSYFTLNNTLFLGLAFVVYSTLTSWRKSGLSNADAVALLWFLASYLGMSVGGRFFGHYFFQILPALCLLGAHGVTELLGSLHVRGEGRRGVRRVVLAVLLIGFVLTLVRFHTRTAHLALDALRGAKSEATRGWFHERLNDEERRAAAYVKELGESDEEVERLSAEEIRRRIPPQRGDNAREDYLFIWGYRPEIYFWSGLRPASRFLSTQPLTGVPADVHYFTEADRPVLDERTTATYREELLRELQANPPRYIIDELGAYNSGLEISRYRELQGFLQDYKLAETKDRLLIYFRRTPKVKKHRTAE